MATWMWLQLQHLQGLERDRCFFSFFFFFNTRFGFRWGRLR